MKYHRKQKKLQKQEQPDEKRAEYVNEIKQKIDSNQYKIDYEKLAQKNAWFLDRKVSFNGQRRKICEHSADSCNE